MNVIVMTETTPLNAKAVISRNLSFCLVVLLVCGIVLHERYLVTNLHWQQHGENAVDIVFWNLAGCHFFLIG